MSNIRFIDSLKVGAYVIENPNTGSNIIIGNNVNNYVLTATGEEDTIKGEPELVFDSINLRIGGEPSGEARLEITHTGSVNNLLLIKNTDNNTGIKINNEGTFQLLEFPVLPTAIAGAIAYSSSGFWIGIE